MSVFHPHHLFVDMRFCGVYQILYIMEPDSWSAASVYAATRIFCSSLNAKMAQRLVCIFCCSLLVLNHSR